MPEVPSQGLRVFIWARISLGEGPDLPWWLISFSGHVLALVADMKSCHLCQQQLCCHRELCPLTSKTQTVVCGYTTGISESKAKVREATSFWNNPKLYLTCTAAAVLFLIAVEWDLTAVFQEANGIHTPNTVLKTGLQQKLGSYF